MPESRPVVPYATPPRKRVDPLIWWLTAGLSLFVAGMFSLFVFEPERPTDAPASPVADTVVFTLLFAAAIILVGSVIWCVVREI